jgi:hypothetical protein
MKHEKIDDLITQISNTGSIDWDKFKAVVLINALGGNLKHIQSHLHGVADDPGFSANTIIQRIQHENDLIKRQAEQGESLAAFVSQTRRCEHLMCTHCRRLGTVPISASLLEGNTPDTQLTKLALPSVQCWENRTTKTRLRLVERKPQP